MVDSAFTPKVQPRGTRVSRAPAVLSAIEVTSTRSVATAKVYGGSAMTNTAKATGCSLMVALPHGGHYLARAIANLAKSDRVVAASRRPQLYDVTAIKSRCMGRHSIQMGDIMADPEQELATDRTALSFRPARTNHRRANCATDQTKNRLSLVSLQRGRPP